MSDNDALVRSWLERELGPVTRLQRQPRWRPVWFATIDGLGEVVVRGDRIDMELIFPLDHEMRFQNIVHQQGLPVPKVYGWIPEVPAYVMETVAGEPYLLDTTDDDRDQVMREYMAALAQLHALDIAPFVAGDIIRAASPSESGLVGLARYEERYRRAKRFPDPLLEFGLAWLRRNPPDSKGRETPITWDSGQFHHGDGHLVAMLDLELGHIGDPMMDLAAFRMRDTIGGFGDFHRLYEWYEESAGVTIDLDAIKRHHFAFTLSNRLAFSSELQAPSEDSDLMTNLQWCRETDLFATEALAEILDIDLPEIEVPDIDATRARPAQEQLVRILRSVSIEDEYTAYEIRKAFRLARHVQRSDEVGAEFDERDLDDLAWFLGSRPATWQAGDAALEAYVLADDGSHDEQLIALFHRRSLRAQALLGPADSAMTHHHAIQRF
ncbi:MAG: aminoglycoside phosphotransferase (APT) family kinase protein [Candidatus Aldehydirespiratoraceae bacterium]